MTTRVVVLGAGFGGLELTTLVSQACPDDAEVTLVDQAEYDGRGICYLEFGHAQVAKVDVTFLAGRTPSGDLEGPSSALAADKAAFGTDRIRRWFDRDWAPFKPKVSFNPGAPLSPA
jgi:NADPH-dependent 2,4-dienoyl-CoA reductase/sulfur reductase-like enzyme